MITEEILLQIAPAARKKVPVYVPHLNDTMDRYSINTLNRVAMFLAEVLHESGGLIYAKELASGTAYEGRADLGNVHPGDGVRYKGRGLIQITGRANYQLLSTDFGVDFIKHPELLEDPEYATRSAGWFWNKHNLNVFADMPAGWQKEDKKGKSYDSFEWITKVINGGQNGIDDRKAYLARGLKELAPLFKVA